jgi:4-diphosphocytidyl-2-C-methyl-D-erythritol kinase
MRVLRLPAFAKINLRLHILGRRPDGYHELRTIFQSISLHDTLELALGPRPGIEFTCDDPALPAGRENLVWRALDAMRRELGIKQGIRARLEKQIPVARGLGGGSSDAAAALLGFLRLTKRALPFARLVELAAGLGADVPYFLFGGRALGVNRGDEIYPLPDGPKRWVTLVSPQGIGVSTRDAFRWAGARLTKRAAGPTLWRFCALCWSPQEARLANDFEAPVFRRLPRLKHLRETLLRRGAAEAALAGSGSAVFGLFPNPAQARRAAQGFSGDQVFVVETLSREEYRRAMGSREFARGPR